MIPTKIECDGFYLRKLKRSDAQSIFENVNDESVVKYTLNIPYPYSVKLALEYISRCQKGWREGTQYTFGIVIDEKVVGFCTLEKVKEKNAMLGYWLGKNFRKKGIMTKAARTVLEFGFINLRLHRIDVQHFEENIASQKVIEKLGFKRIGVEREKYYRFGRWHNHVMYDMLRKEYEAHN